MILDHLSQASLYYGLGERIALALRALAEGRVQNQPPGRYELAGGDVFALVQDYDSKPRGAGRWEAHRHYIDVQFVASGMEGLGVGSAERMQIIQPYDPEKDVLFLADAAGAGNFVTLRAGDFAILFPHEAHLPGQACGAPQRVHKVVVKVRV